MTIALIDHGASIHLQDSLGRTPLHMSSTSPDITKRLLRQGADPNIQTKMDFTQFRSLFLIGDSTFCSPEIREIVQAYAEANFDLNTPHEGRTLLHRAADADVSLISLLLELDANPDVLTDDGKSFLHLLVVSEWGLQELGEMPVSLLRGLNPDLPDEERIHALAPA